MPLRRTDETLATYAAQTVANAIGLGPNPTARKLEKNCKKTRKRQDGGGVEQKRNEIFPNSKERRRNGVFEFRTFGKRRSR